MSGHLAAHAQSLLGLFWNRKVELSLQSSPTAIVGALLDGNSLPLGLLLEEDKLGLVDGPSVVGVELVLSDGSKLGEIIVGIVVGDLLVLESCICHCRQKGKRI